MFNSPVLRHRILTILLIFTGTITLTGNGQSQSVDEQFWMDYNLNVPVSRKFSYGGDAGIRGLISNRKWNQIYFRPSVRYKFHESFNISGSIATFNTFHENTQNAHEFRGTFDFNAEGPDFLYIMPFYRLRIENRSFFYDELPNDNKWRGRLLIGIETWDFKGLNEKRSFFFQGIWEGFQTLGKESAYEVLINQTRIYAAFGHKLSEHIRYELHYIWQRSREYEEAGLQTTQNVIRFRFFHKVGK